MRIAYVAHRIPYPPNKGDKIRSHHHVRHLAARHDVHLFTFVDDAADQGGAAELRRFCREVHVVPLRRAAALARGALSLAVGLSLSEGFYASRTMTDLVRRAAERHVFDVAWAYSSAMGQYLGASGAPWRVLDFVDMDSEKWRQFAGVSRGPLRLAYAIEAARLRRLEVDSARRVDRALFVSETEAKCFRAIAPDLAPIVDVVPNGVDLAYFRGCGSGDEPTLLFTGALDYRPNIDAVLWFTREVLPRVCHGAPGTRLLAVGHRPAGSLRQAADRSEGRLEIAGSVADVRPYFCRAQVFVAPMRLGRGVQNKVLEAMAMGLPVVATPVALDGLEVAEGVHARCASSPDEFAAATIALLLDPGARRSLADAAEHHVRSTYSWERQLLGVDAALPQAQLEGGRLVMGRRS